jgi:hypothetical protein
VTCVKNGFQKALGDTSTPEIEDHEEWTSENELSDVPEEIIMHFIHLIVIQMKILLVLSDLIVLFAYNKWYFAFHALFLYLWHEILYL